MLILSWPLTGIGWFPQAKKVILAGICDAVAAALSRHLGAELLIPSDPQVTAALGAALFAAEL